MPESDRAERSELAPWPEPQLMLDVSDDDGPVTLTRVYRVRPENQPEFVRTMTRLAKARQRTGAHGYELLQEGSAPETFIEKYVAPSWSAYVRQQGERLTAGDRELEQRAHALAEEVGEQRHWFAARPSKDA
jgi:hypothetical protein